MSDPPVVLLGFMGTGKTRVGAVLARRLGWRFVDTDELIAGKAGLPIPEIFARCGEPHFRALEREVVRELAGQTGVVVAGGGGVVLDGTNLELLKRHGARVFVLTASVETILRRTADSDRPLLQGDARARREKAEQLLAAREPLYRAAGLAIATNHKSPEEVADEILRRLAPRALAPAEETR